MFSSSTAPQWSTTSAAEHQTRVTEALKQASILQVALSASTQPPSFENTIVEIERIQDVLRRPLELFKMAAVFDSQEDLVAAEEALAEPLSHFTQGLFQDAGIWKRVQELPSEENMPADAAWLLKQTKQAFQRAGASLAPEERARLQGWYADLAQKEITFGKTLMAATAVPFWVNDENFLTGLPEAVRTEARERAISLNRDQDWAFHLSMPNVRAALETSTNPDFRQALWEAAQARCRGGEHDTQKLIREILLLRSQIAHTMGYKNWASYVLEENMAGSAERAEDLLQNVWTRVLPKLEGETKRIEAALGDQPLRPADWFIGAERVRATDYAFEAAELQAYFPRDRVRQGLFDVTKKLFGLTYSLAPELPVFAERVDAYRVSRDGSDIGLLYVDDFQRPTKRAGAWMEQGVSQSNFDGRVLPVVGNALNLAGSENNPLLTMDDVLTAFHELGHGLHGLLSRVRYTSQSGTQVPRDFVELPSQLLENWAQNPEVLKTFARHHKTGAEMPEELIARWQAANQFNEGFHQAEYLLSAFLDLRIHKLSAPEIEALDLEAFTVQIKQELGSPALLEPRYTLNTFAHAFENGYSARYYAYLWSAVLDADVFSAFQEKDLYNADLTRSLEDNIYAMGHARPVMDSFKAFMGREPDVTALLRRQGLLEKEVSTETEKTDTRRTTHRPR
jgi:peptidyl-dipeptidase Dcp